MNKKKEREQVEKRFRKMGINIGRKLTDEEVRLNTPEGRKKLLKGKKIVVICCFCEDGITNPEMETTIRIGHSNQLYWCHKKCLKSKMTEWARSEFQNG
jgi:hypothetical protein